LTLDFVIAYEVLTYGSETWPLKVIREVKLDRNEMKFEIQIEKIQSLESNWDWSQSACRLGGDVEHKDDTYLVK